MNDGHKNGKPDESDIFIPSTFDGDTAAVDVVGEKLTDAMVPGVEIEFDPDEAERAGAFPEDALNESDAKDSSIDLNDIG